MHKKVFCQKLFDNALGNSIHKKRKACLTKFVSSLLNYDINLSIAEVGKNLESPTTVKHKIKSSHYFMSNTKLAQDIPVVYKGLSHFLFKNHEELTVLVDWSGACLSKYHTLTASVALHGRSLPIYQEIHHESKQGNEQVHNHFLARLKAILPANIKATIVTDAGFNKKWFREVVKHGWDFVGRVPSFYSYKPIGAAQWQKIASIRFKSIERPASLGKVILGKKRQPLEVFLYTYKGRLSRKKHKKNKYPDHEKAHSSVYRQGWVIVSSLKHSAKKLIRHYKKRMQIEQNFKDIKNERSGLGLRRNKSKSELAIKMLYFLAMLINIVLWWIGLLAENLNEHRNFQANTVRTRRVISFIQLGRLVIKHKPSLITWYRLKCLINKLRLQYDSFMASGVLQ